MNPNIFKAYDIRGIYPDDINEVNFPILIKAIYTFFRSEFGKDKLNVLLGRDMRISSPSLFKIAKTVLISSGACVYDVGLVSTPTFYFSVLHYKADCGIQVSASHNPPEWNGVKFVKRMDKKIIKIGKNTGMAKVKNIVDSQSFAASTQKGSIKKIKAALKDEADFAFYHVQPHIASRFKIVADPANAMGITYLKELFRRLPCKLIKMNFKLDGTFPSHQPDPLIFTNLRDLKKKVKTEKADLGIAPDGDGDRVFFIDEKGSVIPASHISALLASELLKNHAGDKIGIDIRYTRNISNSVKKSGGIPVVGPVGHALITELMNKENILFTGESSGHYFYRDTGNAESSVITILRVLVIMDQQKKPISEIVSQYITSFESGESNYILPKNVNLSDILKQFAHKFKSGKISWLDGLSVDYPEWRFSLRSSNTEPLLRLNVEGATDKLVQQKTGALIKQIISFGAIKKN